MKRVALTMYAYESDLPLHNIGLLVFRGFSHVLGGLLSTVGRTFWKICYWLGHVQSIMLDYAIMCYYC